MSLNDKALVRASKLLSLVLRHQPEQIGIELDAAGWVEVDALLAALARAQRPLSRGELDEVVERNNKRRFTFDESGTRIRANQGHSIAIELGLEPLAPLPLLYHGTGTASVAAIEREGLKKMRRQHVHLSPDVATARNVGARHGQPMVFAVDTGAMAAAGYLFWRSANGVWLTDAVPPAYLRLIEGDSNGA